MSSFKKIGLLAKEGNPEATTYAEKLLPIFQKHSCEVFIPKSLFEGLDVKKIGTFVSMETLASSVDLMVSLGGDGTFLKSIRLLEGREVPVIGIKLGSVGFLNEIPKEEAETGLDALLSGNYSVEERMKLTAVIVRNQKEVAHYQALNDIVVHTTGLARISNFKVSLNGQFFDQIRADGILVATPTGSTAYSLAAGGPIVEPKTKAMIITPICAQNTVHRPFVVSEDAHIELEMVFKNSDLLLTADGQEELKLEEGDVIRVNKSDQKALLIRASDSNYLKTLRKKLFLDRLS